MTAMRREAQQLTKALLLLALLVMTMPVGFRHCMAPAPCTSICLTAAEPRVGGVAPKSTRCTASAPRDTT